MQIQKRQKLLFVVAAILVIVTFLSTFIMTGCGRRAKIIAANEKAGQAEEQQSGSQAETVKETEKSGTEATVKETIKEEESKETLESAENTEAKESAKDEETTASESAEETTAEERTENTADMPYVQPECANVYGGNANADQVLLPGDTGVSNLEVRGFISFDISQLSGATIESAKISGKSYDVLGTPIATYGPMIIKAVYWGARAVSPEDFNLDGIEITNNSKNNFDKSPAVLKDDLQNVVNNGINRYQLCFYFEMPQPDGDGEMDNIQYSLEDIDLTVTYSK
jgi:hypothetical protein